MGSNKLERMSKRRFLKVASAMGVSAASLHYGTQKAIAEANDDNYIPYVRALKGEKLEDKDVWVARDPVYGKIHRDEWEVKWTADDAAERIQSKINGHFTSDKELLSSGWRAMDESPSGYGVEVYYQEIEKMGGGVNSPNHDIEEVREKLPDAQVGTVAEDKYRAKREVPVVVNRSNQKEVGCLSDTNWKDPLPGGTGMNSDGGGIGTFAGAYWPWDYDERGMIASGHVCGSTGSNVYNAAGFDCGDVDILYDGSDIDYAWCSADDGYKPAKFIAHPTNGNPDDVEIGGMALRVQLPV